MKQWEVVHPCWGSDAQCGAFKTLDAALEEATRLKKDCEADSVRYFGDVTGERVKTEIWLRETVRLPFGWRLERFGLVQTLIPKLASVEDRVRYEINRLRDEMKRDPARMHKFLAEIERLEEKYEIVTAS